MKIKSLQSSSTSRWVLRQRNAQEIRAPRCNECITDGYRSHWASGSVQSKCAKATWYDGNVVDTGHTQCQIRNYLNRNSVWHGSRTPAIFATSHECGDFIIEIDSPLVLAAHIEYGIMWEWKSDDDCCIASGMFFICICLECARRLCTNEMNVNNRHWAR